MGRLNKEEAIKRFYLIKRLAAEGKSNSNIVRLTGAGSQTIKKYRELDTPPDYDEVNHIAAVARAKARDLSGKLWGRTAERRISIEGFPEISELRKRLLDAFMSGDLDLHAELTQELKNILASAKAVSNQETTTPLLLEAAE